MITATDGGLIARGKWLYPVLLCPSCLKPLGWNVGACQRCRVDHMERCLDGPACKLRAEAETERR